MQGGGIRDVVVAVATVRVETDGPTMACGWSFA